MTPCPLCSHHVEAGSVYCPHCNTFLLPHRRIGEIMIEQKMITPSQLLEGLSGQKKIGQILVDLGYVSQAQVERALEIQRDSATAGVRSLRWRRAATIGLLIVSIGLAGVMGRAWMDRDSLEERLHSSHVERYRMEVALNANRLILAAIEGLKSADPKTVDACWHVLRRGTQQQIGREFESWMNWYMATALGMPPMSGSPAASPSPVTTR